MTPLETAALYLLGERSSRLAHLAGEVEYLDAIAEHTGTTPSKRLVSVLAEARRICVAAPSDPPPRPARTA